MTQASSNDLWPQNAAVAQFLESENCGPQKAK